jgi:hypothetical protein
LLTKYYNIKKEKFQKKIKNIQKCPLLGQTLFGNCPLGLYYLVIAPLICCGSDIGRQLIVSRIFADKNPIGGILTDIAGESALLSIKKIYTGSKIPEHTTIYLYPIYRSHS